MKRKLNKIFIIMFTILIAVFINNISNAANLSSDYYNVDEEENIVSRIEPETEIETFKEKLNIEHIYKNKELTEEVTNGFIGTGMYLKNEDKTYELSVVGDFDGDGKATQVELTKIIRYIVGLQNSDLIGVYYLSGDLTGDGIVDQRDLTKYIKYIVYGELDLGKVDEIAPEVSLEVLKKTSSSIKVEALALDKQTGIESDAEIVFYVKEANGEYQEVQRGENSILELTQLKDNTIYKIKAEIPDKAGNVGFAEIEITTDEMLDANIGTEEQGNIILGETTWSNGSASIEISTNTDYYIEYQVNGDAEGSWTRASTAGASVTVDNLNHNEVINIRLSDGTNAGNYTSITIMDEIPPTVTLETTNTTSTITATANATDGETGIATDATYKFSIKEASQDDTDYQEAQDVTGKTYTFTGLDQNKEYTVKVEVMDIAGNVGTKTSEVTIGRIPDADETIGNITFGEPTWTSGEASVEISTNTDYYIEYQVNGTAEGNWTRATRTGISITVQNLMHNDIVNARLSDGTNAGDYTTVVIVDGNIPTVIVETSTSDDWLTSSIKVTATATDNETGIATDAAYKFFIKEASQADTNYKEAQNVTGNTHTFTGLSDNTEYTIKVEVEDLAGNIGKGTVNKTTFAMPDPDISANITFGTPTWSGGVASIPINTNTDYYIEYQVGGTTEGSWIRGSIAGDSVTATNISHNQTVNARLSDGTNAGDYTAVIIVDENVPTVTIETTNTISTITATASATDSETGIATDATYKFSIKEASQADTSYVEKQNTTDKTYTFTGLEQNKEYTIKVEVEDLAGNVGKKTRNVTTNEMPDADESTGTITFGTVTWTSGKASVEISTNTNYYIEYQVGESTEGNWTRATGAGTSITASNLSHNNVVNARLSDGTNAGDYASITITDGTAPTVTISSPLRTSTTITVSVTATDEQSGMGDGTGSYYEYYLRSDSGVDNSKYTGTETEYTYTDLSAGTTYTLVVKVRDIAGNYTTKELVITTLPDVTTTGNIVFGTAQWSGGKASVEISTNTDYYIEYQIWRTTGDWTRASEKGASITATGINPNETLYARLSDGKNSTDYTSIKLEDVTGPTVEVSTTKTTTSITVNVTATDSQSGMGDGTGSYYEYYLRNNSTGRDELQYGGAETKYTYTGLSAGTTYTLVIKVRDYVANYTTKELTVETEEIKLTDLEAGDYVIYNSGANGNIVCRVLYPSSSTYGLQLISDASVEEISLGGYTTFTALQTAYNNVITTLNDVAEEYINTTYATDTRCVGSNPTNKAAEVNGPVTLSFTYNGSTSVDLKQTDDNYETDYNAMVAAGINVSDTSYWLASRYLVADFACGLGVLSVGSNGNESAEYIGGFGANNYWQTPSAYTHGFRPVVKLKTTLKITGGEGTMNSPYTLGT